MNPSKQNSSHRMKSKDTFIQQQSQYSVTRRYLLFLYRLDIDLENKLIQSLFLGDQRIYQRFIEGLFTPFAAASYCLQIKNLLKHQGLPVSFCNFKQSKTEKKTIQ